MFFSFFLFYYQCRGQKYDFTCLNDRITCNKRIINQLTCIFILELTVLSIRVHISISLILNERLEYESSENVYTVVLSVRSVHLF